MVSTHLKNISQIGSFPQFSGWKFQKYLSCHQLVILLWTTKMQQPLERSYFHDLFQSITVDWLLAERDDFFWDPPNLQSTKSASMISDPVLQLMRYDIYIPGSSKCVKFVPFQPNTQPKGRIFTYLWYSWTFQFGCQVVALQGVNSTCFLGFKDGTPWKVLVSI